MTDQDRGSGRTADSRPQPLDLPPHSVDTEENLLGAIMMNPEALHEVAGFLTAEDFYIVRHGWIWDAFLRLHDAGEPVDVRTVAEALRVQEDPTQKHPNMLEAIGGEAYLNYLPTSVPTALNAEIYGRIVERAAIRRRLLGAAGEISRLAYDEERDVNKVIDEAEKTLFAVTEKRLHNELVPMRVALGEYFERIEELRAQNIESLGVPTGFSELDKLRGGLQKSDLIVIAGRPGMGKCVAAGTLVQTERGMVPIESLKPQGIEGMPDDDGGIFYPLGIGVQTPDGMRQAAHFYDSGVRPTLCITTRGGCTLTGTYVHPVLVLDDTGEEVWKPLKALRPGDKVAVEASWESISNITQAGMQHCYDLTVPDGHAFMTNGIVSHNTSFLLTLALNAARYGSARIAIFSMEMSNEQLVQRMIASETGISSHDLRLGSVNDAQWARFVQAAANMSSLRIFLDDSPAVSAMQLRTKCRRLDREYGLDLIIVDYLQLMTAGTSMGRDTNRVQEITYISRALKELAREINVPLVSAAQLSRAVEQRQDKRPQLSDLRESGSIEQDSDIVMFLYRDEVYNEDTERPNEADVLVAKHRNGPTGTVTLMFQKELTKFVNLKRVSVDLGEY